MLPPATIRKVSYALLLTLLALTDARTLPGRSKQVKVYSYVLPAGAEEIRDDINHSFACANRSDGFYVDIDNDCQIFHRCQDQARFSFICAERTIFSQMYQTCVHDGQLGYPCEDSAQYYPEGEGYEPSAAGSEPAEEVSQPEQQAAAAPEEQAAPAAPAKSSELVVAPAEESSDVEATNEVEPSQDNSQLPSEQAVVKVEEAKDEEEQQQHDDQGAQHQVNADLFDSVEDEGDVPSENSAQEVLDEVEPVVASSAVPTEGVSSFATSQEDTQEVEVMDDSTQPQEHQQEHQQEEHEQFVASEPAPAPESFDATQQSEVVNADLPEETESDAQESAPATPEDLSTQSAQDEGQYAGDALLNAVQTVEELEPIVHDIVVEHADANELQPQVAETAEDPTPAKVDAVEDSTLTEVVAVEENDDNEVLPELETAPADMEAAPLAHSTSSESEVTVDEEALPASAVESNQQVNDLPHEPEVGAVVDTADESSETIVSAEAVATDSDEPEQPASEPEAADVKLDITGEPEEETHVSPSEHQPAADGQQEASAAIFAAEPSRPLESPAIVEEMAPLRPSDSAELPELIVSTEFHLDTATQGPAIRRRKTFLFRADAARLRQ